MKKNDEAGLKHSLIIFFTFIKIKDSPRGLLEFKVKKIIGLELLLFYDPLSCSGVKRFNTIQDPCQPQPGLGLQFHSLFTQLILRPPSPSTFPLHCILSWLTLQPHIPNPFSSLLPKKITKLGHKVCRGV